MPEPTAPAIILGGGYNGLALVQSLAAKGVACWMAEHRHTAATRTRHARFVALPDPRLDEAGFVGALTDLVRRLAPHRPVIFPTHDHFALALARAGEALAPLAEICVAEAPVVTMLCDKEAFGQWAAAARASTPRSLPAADFVPGALPLPVCVKPMYRYVPSGFAADLPPSARLDQLRLAVVRSAAEWSAAAEALGELRPHFLVQEYVEGDTSDMFTVGIYADRASRVRARFCGRKVRGYPVAFGDCVVGEVSTVPDPVLAEVEALVARLGYRGIAEFEYKRDRASGAYRLIEINPRSWSWIGITPAAGVDIPWIAYCDLAGLPVEDRLASTAAPGSIRYVKAMADLYNTLGHYRDRPSWPQSPWQWWQEMRGRRLVVAEVAANDWRVTLASLVDIAKAAYVEHIRPRLKPRPQAGG